MKNSLKILVVLSFVTVYLNSCVKDLGGYDYKVVNEAIISGVDSLYEIEANQVLKIAPKLSFTGDNQPDTSNYRYEWLEIGRTGYNTGIPKVISNSLHLDKSIIASLGLGVYNYSFRVTDKRTGVWNEKLFQILISNDIYEGWFVLSEIEGQNSRLDMLSYKAKKNSFELMPDILELKKSSLVLDGIPSFVSLMNYSQLAIATSKVSRIVSANNLTGFPVPDLNNFDSNQYEAIGFNSKFYGSSGRKYLTSRNRVFVHSVGASKYVQKNYMEATPNQEFKAAAYLSVVSEADALIFNEDISEFVISRGASSNKFSVKINNENMHGLTRGKELMFAKFVSLNGGESYAVMKDKQTNKVYLFRVDKEFKNPQSTEILSDQIAKAEFFEISDEFNYVFYSIGGKLYQYNLSTKLEKLMVDYGERKISMLKFPKLDFIGVTRTPRHESYNKNLYVGSYASNNLNSSGIIEEYSIPPRGEQIIKLSSFEGLGKVRDMAYRNR